jgi:hypothetical protein
MGAIVPVYSVYADTRNGFSVGVHKIHLREDQLTADDTYTWDVSRLAAGTFVGAHLALEGQFPNTTSMTNAGGSNRNVASVFVSEGLVNTYPKNLDGSIDLIYTTLHSGSISNSVRT